MNYTEMRNELKSYYLETSYKSAESFTVSCTQKLDSLYREEMSAYRMKMLQYEIISEDFEPVIFENSPFYYETGIIPGYSDGSHDYHGNRHAGGWTYFKNEHLFRDQDPELLELRRAQARELFYIVCGPYNDVQQHFSQYMRKIYAGGIRGIYERAQELYANCDECEAPFIEGVMSGLLAAKRMAEKFAIKAEELAALHPENENYRLIAKTAARCPWERPETLYEALNACAFIRKAIGTLDGIGPNTFGRLDLDLYPYYEADIREGRLTEEGARELIARFLITWDCHYDHDMKMVGYADHELENTYTLGGCDADGRSVFNDLTRLFLTVNYDEEIIFPKIKIRFSKSSPKAYLDLVNAPVLRGGSTVIYSNDDAVIPALVRAGRTLTEARDYIVAGCWVVSTNSNDCGDDASYMNLLKVFEYQIHNRTDKMAEVGMCFRSVDGAKTFADVYNATLYNINLFFETRTGVIKKGGQIWSKVDPLPFYSSMLPDCLENRRDFTEQGTKYKDDSYMCVGFPNIADSLLAIKRLCFDEKRFALDEFLSAVRRNWEGAEVMRLAAVSCPGWGDGSEEARAFAARFHSDLYRLLSRIPGIYGGRIHLGHLTYTEIRFWGEKTLATPDGRRNGEYFSQGLTPSRLKRIPSVTSVGHSFAAIDKTELAGNCVVNLLLPENLTLDSFEAMLRAFSDTAMESLQLNCVSKETLLDAQKHPERYPGLIIRVCGFSAKFTSLSPEWQAEVISRNFYAG